ncbi:MAG: hypothetical protein BGO82_01340 [Devosia sp. 67-54]|uniref:hypothetical protein n=1 Tax=unclassified Devosia TaxID=196773 RepID=UPI00096020D4|nr:MULTISPECIES: hypothetical protein [unclassified Devosia]MBN9305892.1 hypothetical protein [Devosia sp.]OJX16415.1 MAG: hypothetical protein BGO82_01340 [Devosia sp. 67-54]
MGLVVEDRVRARARQVTAATNLSMREVLTRHARPEKPRYDVFLSQALKDEELVLGIHTILTEDLGLTVFCDWIEAGHSDHAGTTPADAAFIRDKMLASTGLVFVDSEHAAGSNWMSWEIGWFHGAKGRICVLPIVKDGSEHYRGRQYLGLYPVAEEDAQHVLRVSVPLAKAAAGYPVGEPLGLATSLPMKVWTSLEKLPRYFLP